MTPYVEVMLASTLAFVAIRIGDAIWPSPDPLREAINRAMIVVVFTVAYATSLVAR